MGGVWDGDGGQHGKDRGWDQEQEKAAVRHARLSRRTLLMVTPMQKIALRTGRLLSGLLHDCRGIAATEFAVIVPVMLLMFFGTIEFSSGVAVDRKMTLVARLLSDLTSQSLSVSDAHITNFTITAKAELYPYDPTPLNLTVSELWMDTSTSNT